MRHIQKFIEESKKLMDYASCIQMATGYKVREVDSTNYFRLLQAAEKEVEDIKHMDKKTEVIDKMVNAYFEQPERTLKEVFGEYTEDFTEEETKKFFDNLKEIIN